MGTEKSIYTTVPKEAMRVFAENGIEVVGEYEIVEGIQYEIEAYTPAGGGVLHTIELGEGEEDDLSAWRDAFEEMYDEFDPWREAHLWLDEEGNPIPETPYWNGLECYEDYKRYDKEILKPTLAGLSGLV